LCSSLKIIEHLGRTPFGIKVGENQRDGLRMFGVKKFAKLLRVGSLEFGEISLCGLLRAAHHGISRSSARSLPKVSMSSSAGVVEAPVHHDTLCFKQLPKLLQHLRRHLRSDTAQICEFFGEPLHIRLRQGAQNLPRHVLANGHQQHRRLADSG
jgi:hypothetical protein